MTRFDPKRTREALDRVTMFTHEGRIVLNGTRWAVDLFEDCENCNGRGVFDHCGHGPGISHVVDCGTRASSPCPSCGGRGVTLNQERWELVVAKLPYSAVAYASETQRAILAFLLEDTP